MWAGPYQPGRHPSAPIVARVSPSHIALAYRTETGLGGGVHWKDGSGASRAGGPCTIPGCSPYSVRFHLGTAW